MRGRMIWFNAEKGYGFIRTEDDERLYIHESGFADGHVPTGRCAGTEMSFDREPADGLRGHPRVGAHLAHRRLAALRGVLPAGVDVDATAGERGAGEDEGEANREGGQPGCGVHAVTAS